MAEISNPQPDAEKNTPKPEKGGRVEDSDKKVEGEKSKGFAKRLLNRWFSRKSETTTSGALNDIASGESETDPKQEGSAESPVQKEAEDKKGELWNILTNLQSGREMTNKLRDEFPELSRAFVTKKDIEDYDLFPDKEDDGGSNKDGYLRHVGAGRFQKMLDTWSNRLVSMEKYSHLGQPKIEEATIDSKSLGAHMERQTESHHTPDELKKIIDALLAYDIFVNPEISEPTIKDKLLGTNKHDRMTFIFNPKIKETTSFKKYEELWSVRDSKE